MKCVRRDGLRAFSLFALIPLATGIVFVFVLFDISQEVSAHVSTQYGNISLESGWNEEPPLIDEMNLIVVGVTRESENEEGSSTPIRNALADMNIMIKHGGITKSLDFVPSEEEAGWYEAEILPTRIGSYSLVLNGTVQDQPISDEIEIEDVESKQGISFPEAAGSGSGSGAAGAQTDVNLIGGQISNILNQITNDINNINDDIVTLAEANSNIEQGIQDVKDITDRAYMLAVTAIGIGAAGILIGTAALLRTR
jgi:hypothetical protein